VEPEDASFHRRFNQRPQPNVFKIGYVLDRFEPRHITAAAPDALHVTLNPHIPAVEVSIEALAEDMSQDT
jgi:hypothetical protein